MLLTYEQLKELAALGAVIHVYVNDTNVTPTPTPVPSPAARYEYVVDTSVDPEKKNNRIKVYAVANKGQGEIAYVYDGDHLYGPGNKVGEFTEISTPVSGFVETFYIKPVP